MDDIDFRKKIGSNLQLRRKAAGYKSAKAFADSMGLSTSAYTEYEQGRRAMSYERAWQFADALNCTLDELGGRDFKTSSMSISDSFEVELVDCYRSSTAQRKASVLQTARDAAGMSKSDAGCSVFGAEIA